MGSLEALSRLKTVLRQYFQCLGLGLESWCLGLGLGLGGHCLGLGLAVIVLNCLARLNQFNALDTDDASVIFININLLTIFSHIASNSISVILVTSAN